MPPKKRPLTNTNSNAILPPRKKIKGEENDEKGVGSEKNPKSGELMGILTAEELRMVLKGRDLESSGPKEVMVSRLREERDGDDVNEGECAEVDNLDQHIQESGGCDGYGGAAVAAQIKESADSTTLDVETLYPVATAAALRDSPYAAKDHDKLRELLRDRGLDQSGTREEWIYRLHISPDNYDTLTSAELLAILTRRSLQDAHLGNRKIKIRRVRLNDELMWGIPRIINSMVDCSILEEYLYFTLIIIDGTWRWELSLMTMNHPNLKSE